MKAEQELISYIQKSLQNLYPSLNLNGLIQIQKTRKEFEGDFTLVLFPFLKLVGKSTDTIGQEIGDNLCRNTSFISKYNIVKGFLNLSFTDSFWISTLPFSSTENYGQLKNENSKTYLVEYSSPNTNKPLHLGHLRNIFLGYSVSNILKANGHRVVKTQIINDRGIHICKSMLAWKLSGKNETPENTGLKGDKLVGKYYVEFDKALKNELKPLLNQIQSGDISSQFSTEEKTKLEAHLTKINDLTNAKNKLINDFNQSDFTIFDHDIHTLFKEVVNGDATLKDLLKIISAIEKPTNQQKELIKKTRDIHQLEVKIADENSGVKEIAQNKTSLMQQAQKMLLDWEKGDQEVVDLWKKMNSWVYQGFDITYQNIGVDFDHLYYESDTYLLGKDIVAEGLAKGVFFKKDDGSVWCDLTEEGLDLKIVLRSDGTAVYMTQDIGTAILRFKDYPDTKGMVYTVGNEQDYHFKVLFIILKKLGYAFADECFHLSYGMVDLPSGKMKSREGTVVDADDLVSDLILDLEKATIELGKLDDIPVEDRPNLFRSLGLGALKYYMLKVDPKKRMLFNPAESIDIQGNTGPFIQYTYARIQSLLRKVGATNETVKFPETLHEQEKNLILLFNEYPTVIQEAGKNYSPALIANYLYDLVKVYNQFYQTLSIMKEEDLEKRKLRIQLSVNTALIVKSGLNLLGIDVVNRM